MLVLVPLGLLFRRSTRPLPELFHTGGARIRCPACGWEPAKTDRWMCSPGCGHLWNTFDTRGICPSCAKHWRHTACLVCTTWSLHDAWYEHSPDPAP